MIGLVNYDIIQNKEDVLVTLLVTSEGDNSAS